MTTYYYAQLVSTVCVSVISSPTEIVDANMIALLSFDTTRIGRTYTAGVWGDAPDSIYAGDGYIDTSAFVDRLGAAKLTVLSSANATVAGIVKDWMLRPYLSLASDDLDDQFDLLVAAGLSGVNGALKTAVLGAAIQDYEQAQVRLFFPQ